MFRLHETTRRRWCRTAFVVVCLAPLVAIGGLGAFQRMPIETALHQRQLGEQLGLRAKIARVEHPRPGVTRYVDLELADPETGQTVFSAKQAEATLPLAGNGRTGTKVVGEVALVEPRIEVEHADYLRQLLLRALRREFDSRDMEWRVSADTLEIATSSSAISFSSVSGSYMSASLTSQASLEFHASDEAGSARSVDPIQLTVLRDRKGDSPTTSVVLSMHGALLPCDPLLRLAGADTRLGAQCRFQGSQYALDAKDKRDVVLIYDDVDWKATVRGSFLNFDLRRLTAGSLPHQLDGLATLHVPWALFEHGRLVSSECSLTAQQGHVSRSLVTAAIRELGMRGMPPVGKSDPIRYDKLAVSFNLDSQGLLSIRGDCGGKGSGVVLSGPHEQGSLLLAEPAEPSQSVVGLVRLLAPEGDALVPASPQAARLLQWLPLGGRARDAKAAARGAQLH